VESPLPRPRSGTLADEGVAPSNLDLTAGKHSRTLAHGGRHLADGGRYRLGRIVCYMGDVLSVGVVGGGIGGLAAALSLHRAGFDVDVYEQAGSVSEIGAGIQVSPNATRVLHGLGLGDDLAAMGVRPRALHQRRWDDGRTLLRTPLADEVVQAFGFPHYQMHRADLLTTLLCALPSERVHVGYRLVGLADHGDAVEADFENGKSVLVDALVGADGITRRSNGSCSVRGARISPAVRPIAASSRPSA
jgi:hypothetical protein